MDSKKQTILITGCSSGIGLCAAEMLQQRGYRVFAAARKDQDVEKLSQKGLEAVKLDLDDSQSIHNAVNSILNKTNGKLDSLFNNAGYILPGAVEDLPRDLIRKQFESNVFGQIELTNIIIPIMRKQGHGRIIFNTSILGIVAMPYRGAYNASKFALEGFAQTLRQEFYGSSIDVSIIAPGPITTLLRDHAFENYKKTLRDQPSFYKEDYKMMEKKYFKTKKVPFTQAPETVVRKLLHALESKKPKGRYYVSFPAHLLAVLRRLLPERALDWFVVKTANYE